MRVVGLATIVVLALGQPARADGGYIGFGFGGARLGGDLDRSFDTDREIGGRIIGGLRWGDTALEVSFFGTDLHPADGGSGTSGSTLCLGVGLKQYVPLTERVSIYGRAGLDYTWLVGVGGGGPDYRGRGYDLGTGVQLDWRWSLGSGRIKEVGVATWLDGGIQRMRLETSGRKPAYSEVGAVNVGFTFTFGW
jgi:hypothetical protein